MSCVCPVALMGSNRIFKNLEGWACADGDIHYHSEVTAISSDNGHTGVHVQSRGET